jgi:hypothetical protein
MSALESPDVVISYVPFSSRLLVLSSVAALGAFTVLGVRLLRTPKLLRRKNKKIDGSFDDA